MKFVGRGLKNSGHKSRRSWELESRKIQESIVGGFKNSENLRIGSRRNRDTEIRARSSGTEELETRE